MTINYKEEKECLKNKGLQKAAKEKKKQLKNYHLFEAFNIAINILKNKHKTWKDGDLIGFKIGKKHFTIIRNDEISKLKYT